MIRKMTLDDLKDVMILENKCFKVPWSVEAFETELTKNELAHYLVIEQDDVICAYGGVWYIMDEGHITNVAVHPDYRKKGLGQLLVREMIKQARLNHLNHMTLEVRKSNVAAIKLYEKMGFDTAGVRPKYYTDNQEDALIMWLSINGMIK